MGKILALRGRKEPLAAGRHTGGTYALVLGAFRLRALENAPALLAGDESRATDPLPPATVRD